MHNLSSTDLKAILHSKRANMYYLEYCRVMQKGGRVLYLTDADKENLYYNIPIANTTVLLLGNGTSVTQAAMRMLAQAGVLVGFCGGGGTPFYMGCEVEWLTPQSEYRPTQYLQGWLSFWFNEEQRLSAAKQFQKARITYLQKVWGSDRELLAEKFNVQDPMLQTAFSTFTQRTDNANENSNLLLTEAQLTKTLYKYAANYVNFADFTREHQATDKANCFLNHGNYLAYGLAASCLWVLGIPH
ncbi:MAG: type I-F CRISPR-associated endonuclease Cas1f, partial [Enterovibrio sp.]